MKVIYSKKYIAANGHLIASWTSWWHWRDLPRPGWWEIDRVDQVLADVLQELPWSINMDLHQGMIDQCWTDINWEDIVWTTLVNFFCRDCLNGWFGRSNLGSISWTTWRSVKSVSSIKKGFLASPYYANGAKNPFLTGENRLDPFKLVDETGPRCLIGVLILAWIPLNRLASRDGVSKWQKMYQIDARNLSFLIFLQKNILVYSWVTFPKNFSITCKFKKIMWAKLIYLTIFRNKNKLWKKWRRAQKWIGHQECSR